MRDEELDRLARERQALIDYIMVKLEAQDWHAISDACNDIREIEAALDVLDRYQPIVVSGSIGAHC